MKIEIPKELDDRLTERMTKFKKTNVSIQEKKRLYKPLLIVAASIVVAFSCKVYIYPSFTSLMQSIFMESDDDGLKHALKKGHSTSKDRQAKDQGITIKVSEVVADLSRVSLSYKITKEDGELINPSLKVSNKNDPIYLTDTNSIKQSDGMTMIKITGKRQKNINSYGWLAQNQKGQVLEITGHSSENKKDVKGKQVLFSEDLSIQGIHDSEPLILKMIAVNEFYPMNWKHQIK
ncbi:protein of unknown function [Seinonella peptonophila]|uniref:DUF4179 domain-containing protein n=2 Tax=Seinonella peptonophila TaxID=112248 RepID=A0A1M5BGE1_9BACL|nr:protein of unknown function [Seinonella peptonophila]